MLTDADLLDAIIRLLKSPTRQSQKLRELIADIVRHEIRTNG
jgi:hypothetical protein